MKRINRIVAACVAGVLVFTVAQSAFAQGVLEEIVVTAQKAAPAETLCLDHCLDIGGGNRAARSQRFAVAEMCASVQQDRTGDDRRCLFDAES